MKDNKSKTKSTNTKKKPSAVKKKTVQKPIQKKNTNSKNQRKKGSKKQRILKIALIAILSFIILSAIAATIFFIIIIKEAPDFDPHNLYTQESSIVYSADGVEIAKLGTEKREKITYDEMPQILIDAIVATEDSTFFQHNGFNAARFLKATLSQVIGGGGGGASTLTMQVSKNAYTSNVASGFEGIKRKFTDIYLSVFKIERAYTKEEILEFYVNSYYMGGGAYGVEQACQNYFGKSVNNINLAEAAMLAGIYQAPGYYDPTINPERTEQRRQTVLNLMLRHGYITPEEKEIASKLTVDKLINTSNTSGDDQVDPRYKDFIDTTVEDVKKKTGFNPYTTPMLIYTTMDAGKQEYVTNIMNGTTFSWENDKVQAGIAVVDTNTGAVVAIGAGRNRENAVGWNYATMNRKHIGSTAKPLYDYGPLIEYEDASTYHLFYDEPYTYSGGTPIGNWDSGYDHFLQMRDALKVSRNIPALKAFQLNKNENIKQFVTSLGLSPEIQDGYIHEAHAIGAYGDGKTTGENPLSVAAAYAAFANGGYYTEPYTFTKIVYRNNDEEYEHKPVTTKVMSAETAYMVTDMLISTSVYVTKASSVNGVTYGSKTGTSNYPSEILKQYHLPASAVNDLWLAGFCRDYSTAIWYGYDELSSEYYNTSANGGNKRLYKKLIEGIYSGTADFTRPSGVVTVTVESLSPGDGLLPSAYTPDSMKTTALFKAGTEPTKVSDKFTKLDDVTNARTSVQGNNVLIEWDNIKTPNALNIDYLKELYKSTCKNTTECANIVLGNDQGALGNVTYQVYIKHADGSLALAGTSEGSNITINNVPTNLGNTITFVIKTKYAYTDLGISDGIEVTVDATKLKKDIKVTLIGESEIHIQKGTQFNDPGIKIQENGHDVNAQIDKKITKNNLIVQTIDTNITGEYKIIYNVKYDNHPYTLVRTVIIEENSGE